MTVSSTDNRKTYSGDGSTTSFSTNPVVFFDAEDLTVYVVSSAGVVTTLTNDTHYTVTGGGTVPAIGAISLAGGSAPYGAPASGSTLVIVREVGFTQETDFVQNDGSDADVQEATLDRLTMLAQQLSTRQDRSVRQPDSDATALAELPGAVTRASKLVGFDADGAIAMYSPTTSVTDAANMTFTNSGGATGISVSAKLKQYPRSNTEFASLQAVVDSYGNTYANSPGGVRIPANTTSISQASTVTFNNQTGFEFEGAGPYLTTIQATAGLSGASILKFVDGSDCRVSKIGFKALSSGAQIGAAIEANVAATIQPTPQRMKYEDLYIDGQQTGGFSCGIRHTGSSIATDANNDQAFYKNVYIRKCGTGISLEHYNALAHNIFHGTIGDCGVGISTANIGAGGQGGSFSVYGGFMTGNTTADFDIGDNSTHSIDIVNHKSEGSTGLWIRCLKTGTLTHGAVTGTFTPGESISQATSGATGKFVKTSAGTMTIYNVSGTFDGTHVITGGSSGATATSTSTLTVNRTDINVLNSTWHGTYTGTFLDYRSGGKLVIKGCQMQPTGTGRKMSFADASSVVILEGNFMDIDTIEYAGTLIMIGNKYAGSLPTITALGTSSRLIFLDKPVAPVTTTASSYSFATNITVDSLIVNYAGIHTVVMPNATLHTGETRYIKTITANTVVSDAANVVPAAGGAAGTAILAATAGKWAILKSDGTSWQTMAAN